MAFIRFPVFAFAMVEQRFSHSRQSVAARTPSSHPNRIGIHINWNEGHAMAIDVRRGHVAMARRVYDLNWRRRRRQGYEAQQFAWDAGDQLLFDLLPERRTT